MNIAVGIILAITASLHKHMHSLYLILPLGLLLSLGFVCLFPCLFLFFFRYLASHYCAPELCPIFVMTLSLFNYIYCVFN